MHILYIKENIKMSIGKNIKYQRERNNLTQSGLADLLGVSNKTVSSWEIDRTEPKIGMVEKICEALNCKKTDIIGSDLQTVENRSDDWQPQLTKKDERDIAHQLEKTLADLESSQDALMFSGEPLDEETRELLKISLENSIRVAKIAAKKKYTPKKYRK
mgnify:CR=1 FL=1